MRLYAANLTIIQGLFLGTANFPQNRHNGLIIEVRRHPNAAAGHFSCSPFELLAAVFVPANRQGRLGKFEFRGHLAAKQAHLIGGVIAVTICSAYNQILEHGISAKGQGSHIITQLTDFSELDPQASQQFFQILFALSRSNTVLIAAPGVLVKTPGRHTVTVGINLQAQMEEPKTLQRFLKCIRPAAGHFSANPCDFQQLIPADGIGRFTLLFCQGSKSLCKINHGIADNLTGTVKRLPLNILCTIWRTVANLFVNFVEKILQPPVNQPLIIHTDMPKTAR